MTGEACVIGAIPAERAPSGDPTEDPVDLELAWHAERMLALLGEDPAREGLRRTPLRMAKALRWLTGGAGTSPREALGRGVFSEAHEGVVIVRDIEFHSLCEHHLLPFSGIVHVGYLPDRRIVGLSKIPRLVGVLARRLQVQERFSDQVADALMEALAPKGVGVVVEARHLCMMMRGVRTQGALTLTSAMRGAFREPGPVREEFLQAVRPR